jgi:hypothetical protein
MELKAHTCLLIASFFLVWRGATGEVTQNEDGTEGTISFQTPTLNDEEAHSIHMPSHLKCDACTAVVYQVNFATSFFFQLLTNGCCS